MITKLDIQPCCCLIIDAFHYWPTLLEILSIKYQHYLPLLYNILHYKRNLIRSHIPVWSIRNSKVKEKRIKWCDNRSWIYHNLWSRRNQQSWGCWPWSIDRFLLLSKMGFMAPFVDKHICGFAKSCTHNGLNLTLIKHEGDQMLYGNIILKCRYNSDNKGNILEICRQAYLYCALYKGRIH